MATGTPLSLGEPMGTFYGWRRGWPLPAVLVKETEGLAFGPVPPGIGLGAVPPRLVADRVAAGHQPFALWHGDEVVSYGWSSSGTASIGEIDFTFEVPPDQRYLWDFATLPPYRGRGYYPRLLQAILRRQSPLAEWFWIGHEADNEASRRGILKAGFRPAGQAWRRPDGRLAFTADPEAEPVAVRQAARTLGVPVSIA